MEGARSIFNHRQVWFLSLDCPKVVEGKGGHHRRHPSRPSFFWQCEIIQLCAKISLLSLVKFHASRGRKFTIVINCIFPYWEFMPLSKTYKKRVHFFVYTDIPRWFILSVHSSTHACTNMYKYVHVLRQKRSRHWTLDVLI